MPYIHNFKEQTHLTANCFNKINFQTISSITIDFYIVSSFLPYDNKKKKELNSLNLDNNINHLILDDKVFLNLFTINEFNDIFLF